MASPTVSTKNFQTIWDCESTTGAVGNKPVLETEMLKQGSNSVGFTMTTVGTNNRMAFNGTIPNSGNLTAEHVRLWYTSIVFPNIDSYANGGIRFYMQDSTGNESYWNIAGKDTYNGGWINICVYTSSTPNSNNGTNCDISDVVELGVIHNFATSPKNLTNGWVDYFRIGDGLIAYGGSSGDEIDMEGIYLDDVTNGYGIVEKYEGKYFLSGSVEVGDAVGIATTYFKYQSGGITFADKIVSSSLYAFTGVGNNTGFTHIDLAGTFMSTTADNWVLDMDSASLDSCNLDGCTIQGAIDFFGSSIVTGNGTVFDACGMLEPGSTDMDNFVIKNGTEPHSLLWPAIPYMAGGQFIDNDRGIKHDTAGDVTYDNFTFSGNNYQADFTVTGSLNIYVQNGGNVAQGSVIASGGGTITVYNQRYKAFSGLPTNTEVRIRQGSYTLDHEQNVTGGTHTFYYDPDNSKPAKAQFTLPGYVLEPIEIYLDSNDQTFPVTVKPDPSYV